MIERYYDDPQPEPERVQDCSKNENFHPCLFCGDFYEPDAWDEGYCSQQCEEQAADAEFGDADDFWGGGDEYLD